MHSLIFSMKVIPLCSHESAKQQTPSTKFQIPTNLRLFGIWCFEFGILLEVNLKTYKNVK